ncbi:MFS transporter [Paracoccus sp. SM22M-07]|uniref:MFS transporter n=1 Tax=Paracoccus sp. SM22M-07 TaxID=1520813 RepID=UPI0009125FDC|nr:MFS transporter [Paracoccus sp. SM22M-07]OJH44349.1 MFS transporter [Paracoccus sp. SM22M-07]
MIQFLRDNLRWLGAGLLLTFTSAFGQTWFISLFAVFIKDEHGLTDGSWGSLYTVATLSAAGLMFWRGGMADSVPLSRLAPAVALVFAFAAIGMAWAPTLWILGVALFLLRFCGQGMFSHIAMTAMGRWFEARRGQAVSITNLGHPAGEIIVPLLVVLLIGSIGWRGTWLVVAAVLCLAVAPLLSLLLSEARAPVTHATQTARPGLLGRQWRRRDAVRHWLLPALLPVLLTPGFIATVIFFHQAHVAQVKGWTLAEMAPGYTAFGISTVIAAFASGWAADRFGVIRLLPLLLLPMGVGVSLIGPAESVAGWYVALAVVGVTQGMAGSLWGVLFPVLYGTAHLGAIRSLATTIMVISTAIGPGITGILIDMGVDFPTQSLFLGLWCAMMVVLCWIIAARVRTDLATG